MKKATEKKIGQGGGGIQPASGIVQFVGMKLTKKQAQLVPLVETVGHR
jgi:hypothetical protein